MDSTGTNNYAINDLIRRVDATYRIRINAAIRLRSSCNHYKKLNMYYSALITGVSIITIGFDTKFLGFDVSNIVLMLSIVLSYFAFHISEQNLQERAYRMEETYRELDKLRNKLTIYFDHYSKEECTEEFCKKMYKQYEQIISNIENHLDIDYKKFILYQYTKRTNMECNEEKKCNIIKNEILKYEWAVKFKSMMQYIIPMILIIIIMVYKEKKINLYQY